MAIVSLFSLLICASLWGILSFLESVLLVLGGRFRLERELSLSRRDPRLRLNSENLADVWGKQQTSQLPDISIVVVLNGLCPLPQQSDGSQ